MKFVRPLFDRNTSKPIFKMYFGLVSPFPLMNVLIKFVMHVKV